MKINTSLLSLFLLIASCVSAQKENQSDVTNVAKVTIINPGFSFEQRIGKHQTLYGQVFMNTAFSFNYSSTFGGSTKVYFDPAVTLQYRYYYNINRRLNAEKRIDMNSLNYVGAVWETVFSKQNIGQRNYDELKARPINKVGVVWGFQRNYKSRFSLDVNVGPGYLFAKQTTSYIYANPTVKETIGQPTILGQVNIGIWLNKRKAND